MKGFFTLTGTALALALTLLPYHAKAFDKTSGGVAADATMFGGMSKQEKDALNAAKMRSFYLQAVSERVKKFEEGNISSGENGKGRYSNSGEAHVHNADGMVAHEGGANDLEKAIEFGVFGSNSLSGEARSKKEKEIMDQYCVPITTGQDQGKCVNFVTKKVESFGNLSISGAMYDAGSAHRGTEDTEHRTYGIRKEVKDAVLKAAPNYAAQIVADATAGPGKQPNFDLLMHDVSKLEQDKYIEMASSAYALKAARLAGRKEEVVNTAESGRRFEVGEFKQIAIDSYASHPGDVASAEKDIEKKLADAVAERRAVNNSASTGICAGNGQLKPAGGCTGGDGGDLKDPTAAAKAIAGLLQGSPDSLAVTALADKIKSRFQSDLPQPYGNNTGAPKKLQSVLDSFSLSELAGVGKAETMQTLYKSAANGLDSDGQAKLAQYKSRLTGNQCFNLMKGTFCADFKPPAGTQATGSNSTASNKIDDNEYAVIQGEAGSYFKDTRERLYTNFVQAYKSPLNQWKQILDSNGDFYAAADGAGNYAEFTKLYDKAIGSAKDINDNADAKIIDAYKSAGMTDEQLKAVQKNYSTSKFDPSQRTYSELFGQQVGRDALAMEWRQPGRLNDPTIDPNYNGNANTVAPPAPLPARVPASRVQKKVPMSLPAALGLQ